MPGHRAGLPHDPQFPYVGKFVDTLTLAEVKTLDCGSKTLPQFPEQVPSPGAQMPLLSEVFDLVQSYHAYGVWGSLMRMHQVYPQLPLLALDNIDFLQVGQPGKSVWLGGIDIDDSGGDPLKAIKSFGPVPGRPCTAARRTAP